jgi:hypothetical protein
VSDAEQIAMLNQTRLLLTIEELSGDSGDSGDEGTDKDSAKGGAKAPKKG